MLVASFLEQLDNEFSNAGCNDLYLPDSIEMRLLVEAADKEQAVEQDRLPEMLRIEDEKIGTNDQMVLGYLRDKIMKHYNIKHKELVRV